jgi:hypothetical protein
MNRLASVTRQRAPLSGPQRATSHVLDRRFGDFLGLQEQVGNAAVARMLAYVQRCGDHVSPGCACAQREHIARQPDDEPSEVEVDPVADVTGHGRSSHEVAHGVVLRGRTDADFDGGSFNTADLVTQPGAACKQCKKKNCVHLTGKVVTTYHVTTKVSLPSVSQFKGLTPCQREAVRQAIEGPLASHEQDHVTAFEQYNGTSEQPFDLTTCRNLFPGKVTSMVRTEEAARRKQAKADSKALDPFQIDVDLDCTDT